MSMADPAQALRLLAWLSPAFPTGAFAYSHGIEWAVDTGDIADGDTLFAWLADLLRHGSGRSDAILLRHAYRAQGDLAALGALVELALAAQPSRERRAEAVGQGNAFAVAARAWEQNVLRDLAAAHNEVPYAVAVGALAGACGLDEELTVAGVLQGFAANLISAAVRLVPLGQTVGLAVLARLEPVILAVTAQTSSATLDDVGSFCFRSDIASMRHETQYTRLFRS
jgi:urease accessory protein